VEYLQSGIVRLVQWVLLWAQGKMDSLNTYHLIIVVPVLVTWVTHFGRNLITLS